MTTYVRPQGLAILRASRQVHREVLQERIFISRELTVKFSLNNDALITIEIPSFIRQATVLETWKRGRHQHIDWSSFRAIEISIRLDDCWPRSARRLHHICTCLQQLVELLNRSRNNLPPITVDILAFKPYDGFFSYLQALWCKRERKAFTYVQRLLSPFDMLTNSHLLLLYLPLPFPRDVCLFEWQGAYDEDGFGREEERLSGMRISRTEEDGHRRRAVSAACILMDYEVRKRS